MARRRKNRVLQRIEYTVYRLIAGAVRRMSEERVARWGARLGALSRRVLRSRDRLAMRNLREAFPAKSDRELRDTLDTSWRYFGWEMLEFVRAQSYSLEQLAERCPFVNAEILEQARARGKGTLLLSGHFGGWEIAGLAIMSIVNDVRTVARPLDNELLERDLAASRARTGVEVVDRRRAARALLKGLAENAVVVLLPDQAVQPREGVLVPFMGRKAWTTDAPAKLALRSGATIVFAFCIPDRTRHRLEFEGPIVVDELNESERNPVALTERINDVISRRIAARPELWLWMHDRWKGTGESQQSYGQ
ncbi:MAG TPA: lysophospholipid acyltransferase family protein [Thermoanaerobaculia bacterium]|jgi:KDO2-lipid IV(A) lauroyltransferase|nr:lysophospholipid acyltransferase family protein [Thermoanaerobaculia bacterium]